MVATAANYPSVAALNASRAVVCWDDDGTAALRCQVLEVSGMDVVAGAAASSSLVVKDVSMCGLDESTAIVCYVADASSDAGVCNVLTVGATTLSLGASHTFDSGTAVKHTSVSALDSTHAVVCYKDNSGKCELLTVSGTTLSSGSSVNFYSYSIYSTISVAGLDATRAIVCYTKSSHSYHGACRVVSRSGSTGLSSGTETSVNPATTYDLSVAALDAGTAVVCYRDSGGSSYGRCSLLERSSTTLTASAESVFNSATTQYVSVAALDSQTVVACYRSGSGASTCNRLFRGSGGVSAPLGSLVVYPGATTTHSVARLGTHAAVVCYDASSDGVQCSN